jgi:hypothetical protein
MTTQTDNGGPAFPVAPTMNPDGSVWYHGKDGMSLRDYFAAAALQGFLAQPLDSGCNYVPRLCAQSAYDFADAMLAARKEGA